MNNQYIHNIYIRSVIKVVLFFALFTYIYPVELKSFPVSPLRLFQIMGFVYFIFHLLKKKRINKILLSFYRYGVFVFMIGFFATVIWNKTYEFQFALRGLYVFLFSFLGYFIMDLMMKTTRNFSLFTVLEWMIFITVIQASISFLFFFQPNILAMYNELVVMDEVNEGKIELLNSFRLVGVGAIQYATAAVQYGIMLWTAILLYNQKGSWLSNHSIVYYLILALFCIAGGLSGRTFFIMLFATFLYILYMNGRHNFFSSIKHILILISLLGGVGIIAVFYVFAGNDEALKWVFEIFINLDESGSLESDSTNQLQGMYIFPDNFYTWLLGDGRTSNGHLGFYMDTDVGYIRSVFYWGIIGSIVYYYIQFRCYILLKKEIVNREFRKYMYFILLWFFVYNLKDFWRIDQFFILFLMAALCVKNNNLSEITQCKMNL